MKEVMQKVNSTTRVLPSPKCRKAKSVNTRPSNRLGVKNGFTLIELLIVMAIIGILLTLASVNFIAVRERARDAQRKSDLAQIQIALELYRSDTGSYPADSQYPDGCNGIFQSNTGVHYLKKTPCDPLDPKTQPYFYSQRDGGLGYCLRACFENNKDNKMDENNNSVPGCTLTACENGRSSYTVQNP
jgi:type II secretion system protein G